jgi:protein-tyrosine phosphatase
MIDFHSHFLPQIDDGAKRIEESLEMLRISKETGVDTIVSTSHCYAFEGNNDIKHFLKKRNSAYSQVLDAIGGNSENYPNIVLGCEVHLVPKLSTFPDLQLLCIENTNYILLEMPSSDWKDEDFEEIYQITKLGLKPIIAHIDRYFDMEEQFNDLFSLNLLFQANAESFFSRNTRRKLYELIKKDALHIIGSDMHNIDSRPPNIAEAYALIENKFGEIYAGYLDFASHKILENNIVPAPRLPKLSFIKKIKL